LDARVRWDEDEFMDIQRRVLLLRRTAAEVITLCQSGKSADLRVKKLNLFAPSALGGLPLASCPTSLRAPQALSGRRQKVLPLLLPMGCLPCHHKGLGAGRFGRDGRPEITADLCRLWGQVRCRTVHVRTLPATTAGRM
jgi:hypothetical protein